MASESETLSLSRAQLMMLRGLNPHGWEVSLTNYILTRTGGTQAEWDALRWANYVEQVGNKWELTAEGRRQYRKQKEGKYF